LPSAHEHANDERSSHSRASGKRELIPSNQFLKPVGRRSRPGDHRFVTQVPLEIRSETVCRLVTPRAVFLQALHDDPVEVAPQQRDRLFQL
jgi:hypothetical protein